MISYGQVSYSPDITLMSIAHQKHITVYQKQLHPVAKAN